MTEITLRKSAIDTISANTLDENSGLRVQVKENDLLTDLQSANLLTNQQLITVQFADLADLDLPDFTTVFVSDVGCNSLNTPGGSLWYTKGDLWYPVGGQVTNYYLADEVFSTPKTASEIVHDFELPAKYFRDGAVVNISYGWERVGNAYTGDDLTMWISLISGEDSHGLNSISWDGQTNQTVVYQTSVNLYLSGNPKLLYSSKIFPYVSNEGYWAKESTFTAAEAEEAITIAFKVSNLSPNNDNLKIKLTHFDITTRFF